LQLGPQDFTLLFEQHAFLQPDEHLLFLDFEQLDFLLQEVFKQFALFLQHAFLPALLLHDCSLSQDFFIPPLPQVFLEQEELAPEQDCLLQEDIQLSF
jgi:hypothetical protein